MRNLTNKKIEEMNNLERFLHELLLANPSVILPLFLAGQCNQLINIVKSVFPDAEHYTDDRFAHSYIKWNEEFYDITGQIDKERLKGIPIGPAPIEDNEGPLVYGPNTKDRRNLFLRPNHLDELLHDDFYKNQYKKAKNSPVPRETIEC